MKLVLGAISAALAVAAIVVVFVLEPELDSATSPNFELAFAVLASVEIALLAPRRALPVVAFVVAIAALVTFAVASPLLNFIVPTDRIEAAALTVIASGLGFVVSAIVLSVVGLIAGLRKGLLIAALLIAIAPIAFFVLTLVFFQGVPTPAQT